VEKDKLAIEATNITPSPELLQLTNTIVGADYFNKKN
jgi:hypothetical protein